TLERTTNGTGWLRERDFAELSQLDAGHRFRDSEGAYSFRGKAQRIPRLAEVLTAFPTLGFNIEIKERAPSTIAAVLAELSRFSPRELVLTAADDAIMSELEAMRAGVPLGLSKSQCWRAWWRSLLGCRLSEG